MARKVILDVDPGIDDAVAMCLALMDPRLEVVAVTATGGNVSPQQASRNVQAVIEQLDPPRLPRIGNAPDEISYPSNTHDLNGKDGLGDANFQVVELQHKHPSEKLLCDEIRTSPGDITVIALGPLTNIAAALIRDPEIASMIGHLIIMGGTLSGPGNVTPAAEFNFYCDPESARKVLLSPITKTLVPLDVADQLVMTFSQFDQLPSDGGKGTAFLQRILPYTFRAHRQLLGQEGIYLHDTVALMAAVQPELFQTEPMYGDVETIGELTKGAIVLDRRPKSKQQPNMDVVVEMDTEAVMDCVMRGLGSIS